MLVLRGQELMEQIKGNYLAIYNRQVDIMEWFLKERDSLTAAIIAVMIDAGKDTVSIRADDIKNLLNDFGLEVKVEDGIATFTIHKMDEIRKEEDVQDNQ